MRLLDRYLLREFLVPLGYCLCGFLTLWISFDLFAELNRFQSKKLHGGDIAEYYLVNMPETGTTPAIAGSAQVWVRTFEYYATTNAGEHAYQLKVNTGP